VVSIIPDQNEILEERRGEKRREEKRREENSGDELVGRRIRNGMRLMCMCMYVCVRWARYVAVLYSIYEEMSY